MCNIKVRNEIRSKQDVQNLITAIILRQKGVYTKKYLVKATNYYLPDPKVRVVVDPIKVEGMIDETLAVFRKNGKVKSCDGKYMLVSSTGDSRYRGLARYSW